MRLVNFAHPLTPEQCKSIEHLSGHTLDHVIEVKTQFDHEQPFTEQQRQVVDAAIVSSEQWQTTPLLINTPNLSVIAGIVLGELHGRCGYFPAVLCLKPIPLPPNPCDLCR